MQLFSTLLVIFFFSVSALADKLPSYQPGVPFPLGLPRNERFLVYAIGFVLCDQSPCHPESTMIGTLLALGSYADLQDDDAPVSITIPQGTTKGPARIVYAVTDEQRTYKLTYLDIIIE